MNVFFWTLTFLLIVTLSAQAAPRPVETFTFARITDTHIGSGGTNVAADSERVAFLNALTPRPAFVVNTGDLVDEGTAAQYQTYQQVFSALTMPLYDMPGNHDVRWAPLGKESIQDAMHIPLYRSFDHGGCHFVLLDSTVTLEHWGHLEADEMRWLARDLKRAGQAVPVFIFLHHWVGRGEVMVDNEDEFFQAIAPYNVKIVFCGHGHADIQWRVNGVQYVMERGLYQGSFDTATVTPQTIILTRYRKEDKTPTVLAVLPTAPPLKRSLQVSVSRENQLSASIQSAERPPEGAQWQWRLDSSGPWQALPSTHSPALGENRGAVASLDTAAWTPGHHSVNVRLVVPLPAARREESHDQDGYGGDVWVTRVPLEIKTGALTALWRRDIGGTVQSRLLYHEGTVYVSCFDGALHALDARTGRMRWTFPTRGTLFSPPSLADNGFLYVGSTDHTVYSLDPKTGKEKWRARVGGPVFAGVRVGDGVACVGAGDSMVYGLDALTGKHLWTYQAAGFIQSQAAFGEGAFYVGAWDNGFYALDARTGALRWRKRFGRSFFYSPAIGAPTVFGDKVYVPSNDDTLHAVIMKTGEVAWETHAPEGAGSFGYSSPAVTPDGRLYLASLGETGTVMGLDAQTGKALWRADTGHVIYDSSCAVAGGVVTVGSVSGDFHAIDAATGALLGTYHLGTGHLLASPAMTPDGRTAYIGTMGNAVTALQLPPSKG